MQQPDKDKPRAEDEIGNSFKGGGFHGHGFFSAVIIFEITYSVSRAFVIAFDKILRAPNENDYDRLGDDNEEKGDEAGHGLRGWQKTLLSYQERCRP